MLDNEPTNGAEGAAGTTETTDAKAATPPPGDGGVRVTTPASAKGARRAAGPPPEPDDTATTPSQPVTTLAGSGEVGTVKTSVAAAPRKRTVRAAGSPAEEAPARRKRSTTRATAKKDAEAAPAEEPRTAGRKGGRRKAAEPAPAEEARAVEPKADEAASSTGTEEAPGGGGAVFQSPTMLFQPPVAQQGAPARAESAEAEPAEDEESAEETDALAEEPAESAEAAEAADTAEERPSRRRRRRGGRGRGRSRTGEETGGETAETAGRADEEREREGERTAEETAETTPEQPAAEEGERGSRRRRRRRRRAGSATETTTDDPPNTVVKVREPRQEKPIEDEVQAVRGSTRLEAKKQRRREGREQGRRRAPIVTESEFLARRESVKRDLVIRRNGDRTQIAVLEDDVLVEHYVDRATHRSYVGNVYLGRVQNVLPSMEAAFVDIGKGRNAVLYAGEVNWDSFGLDGQPKRIESVLKSGQSVLVQVTKDPIAHKGARLTSQISLPGRYLVYVPGGSMTGISRKLPDKERARLKQILKKVMPSGAGVIVRTAAEGASEEELERDISRLANQWESIKRKSKSASAPSLLNSEPDLTVRVVRDVFNEDFSSLVVSGEEAWSTVHEYVDYVAPNLSERLSHWTEDRDVFAAYRIDEQINKALERKVWLPSGGSLIIDRTEAMTVVDVNTGKFTGQGGNLEETVTKNNLEAAEEIVRQLRLRDIGGIIVIDFIDMVLESNRDLVLRRMLECLSRDRTKHQVAEVTSLGLVQMTRKRVGQGLLEAFSHSCDHCSGRGLVLSTEPVEGKGGNGGRKKKKGKGEADQPSDKADKAEKAEKQDKAEKADKSEKQERAQKAEKRADKAEKKATAAKAGIAEEPVEPAPAAEEPAEPAEKPAKRTRKRTTRARKGAEVAEEPTGDDRARTAPAGEPAGAEPQEAAERPAAEAAEPTEAEPEAPVKKTRTRRTTTRRTARAAAEAPAEDTAPEPEAPAAGTEDEAGERPKRRRTRRTKAAATSPTAVEAG
ncbi:Rne/Rng family ribonuclease [Nocardiopsis sp. EMB25]|uniref:ribonuclease E/G n=1 Tax=Nocardiopsis sp. EMB25 TaxID=2835867 RepID=UPI002284BA88|nr:ribonuclease E/G [Nocardiopsis sp. EMB25]MCY9785094.1 Rne/Rng family ribonuclease [Nocardiopsis sp. EMB25]